MRTPTDLIRDLEQRGEASVKAGFLNGDYKPPAYETVKEWLSSKESERAEARDEESLSNSREALRIARLANVIAITAIVIAIIAIMFPIVVAWFQKK